MDVICHWCLRSMPPSRQRALNHGHVVFPADRPKRRRRQRECRVTSPEITWTWLELELDSDASYYPSLSSLWSDEWLVMKQPVSTCWVLGLVVTRGSKEISYSLRLRHHLWMGWAVCPSTDCCIKLKICRYCNPFTSDRQNCPYRATFLLSARTQIRNS